MTWLPERYADEPDPGELLVCRRPPCHGRLYHDAAWHDWMSHGGPRPPGASTTPFDPDPRYVEPGDPVRRRELEDEAFASTRTVAIVITVLMVAVFVITIVLVSGRPAPS